MEKDETTQKHLPPHQMAFHKGSIKIWILARSL